MNQILMILLACAGLCTGCGQFEKPIEAETAKKAEYRKISADQAKEMMSTSTDYILLDVRSQEEFNESRIDGAVLIPDFEIRARAEKELLDKDALIFVYCRSGRRSILAAQELCSMGYTKVYDFGGITDWQYATISGN